MESFEKFKQDRQLRKELYGWIYMALGLIGTYLVFDTVGLGVFMLVIFGAAFIFRGM